MAWLSIVLMIIPAVIKLAKIAEKAFDGIPDSSADKKLMVSEGIRALCEGLSGVVLTPELWVKINAFIDPFIDLVAGFLFPSDK